MEAGILLEMEILLGAGSLRVDFPGSFLAGEMTCPGTGGAAFGISGSLDGGARFDPDCTAAVGVAVNAVAVAVNKDARLMAQLAADVRVAARVAF